MLNAGITDRKLVSYRKVFFGAIALLISSFGSLAQHRTEGMSLSDRNRNTNPHGFYFELGGSALIYSVNYERLIFKTNSSALFGRVGFQYLPFRRAQTVLHLPVGANMVWGQKRLKLETGMGALIRIDFNPVDGGGFYLLTPPTRIFLNPTLGLRYFSKPNEYGEYFMMRFTFTPLIGMNVFASPVDNSQSAPYFFPFVGVSFGRTWKKLTYDK